MNNMSDTHLNLPKSTLEGVPDLYLYSGAKFDGVQTSRYTGNLDIKIELLNVDKDNDFLCGFITIIDLNYDSKHVQRTYFNGEIVSQRYPFHTRKWFADSETDKRYWGKFGGFSKYLSAFGTPGNYFDYSQLKFDNYVFMRWKECRGIGSDHGVIGSGFHYIRLNKMNGNMESIYYEKYRPEWCETTFLAQFVPQRSIPVFQFR